MVATQRVLRAIVPLLVLAAALAAAPAPPSPLTAEAAVRGLLGRLLPPHVATQFDIEHCPLSAPELAAGLTDYFALWPADASSAPSAAVVKICGSSGLAMASGVRHYLWHYANTSFSWWGDNLENLPQPGDSLPSVPAAGVRKSTTLKYRMAINSCAFGYTTPYWNLTNWIREIDLMGATLTPNSGEFPSHVY